MTTLRIPRNPITGTPASGVIVWEGPSRFDGSPIVVIATGIGPRPSANTKTGDMVQVWILRADMHPTEAIRTDADAAICGDCKHRGTGGGAERSCYVDVPKAPASVYRAYTRGAYPRVSWSHLARIVRATDRRVRLGAYGDPALLPLPLARLLVAAARGGTGYTHAWRRVDPRWSSIVMASADSVADRRAARALGYRSFYVAPVGADLRASGAMLCSAVRPTNPLQCADCVACAGTRGTGRVAVDVAIEAHGIGARYVTA